MDVRLLQRDILFAVDETGVGVDVRHPAFEVLLRGRDPVGVDVPQPSQREQFRIGLELCQHQLQEPALERPRVRVQEKRVLGGGVR